MVGFSRIGCALRFGHDCREQQGEAYGAFRHCQSLGMDNQGNANAGSVASPKAGDRRIRLGGQPPDWSARSVRSARLEHRKVWRSTSLQVRGKRASSLSLLWR